MHQSTEGRDSTVSDMEIVYHSLSDIAGYIRRLDTARLERISELEEENDRYVAFVYSDMS
jgi:hypothetical protein